MGINTCHRDGRRGRRGEVFWFRPGRNACLVLKRLHRPIPDRYGALQDAGGSENHKIRTITVFGQF